MISARGEKLKPEFQDQSLGALAQRIAAPPIIPYNNT